MIHRGDWWFSSLSQNDPPETARWPVIKSDQLIIRLSVRVLTTEVLSAIGSVARKLRLLMLHESPPRDRVIVSERDDTVSLPPKLKGVILPSSSALPSEIVWRVPPYCLLWRADPCIGFGSIIIPPYTEEGDDDEGKEWANFHFASTLGICQIGT